MQADMHHTEARSAIRNGTVAGADELQSDSGAHRPVASGGDRDDQE